MASDKAVSDRVTFRQCMAESMTCPELVAEFDRLTGSNLSLKGSPINLMIDDATGRIAGNFAAFMGFVMEFVYLRLPPDALVPIRDDPDREFLEATMALYRTASGV